MNADRAIVLTPPGAAAIAVLRLLGPGVAPFLSGHFSRPARAGRCVHGLLTDAARVIDDPVVVLSAGGDSAELNLHGGPWVLRSILDLLQRSGFTIVPLGSGELPSESLDAATALEREVEAYLPLARTEVAVRTLLAQPAAWAELARDPDPAAIRTVLADASLQFLLHPPRVAIVGPANVGKSTLANQLFAQERSIVADLPGTTRDWVGELANINGLAVTLVDTPGLRDTEDPIERAAIYRSTDVVTAADLVLVVLDATRPIDGEQSAVLTRHPGALVVLNKSDEAPAPPVGLDAADFISTVATTGLGVDALRRRICRHFSCDQIKPHRPRWWTVRQKDLLSRALADPAVLAAGSSTAS